MNHLRYVLGIDLGASKTHAIISDENGNVVGMQRYNGLCSSSSSDPLPIVEHAVRQILKESALSISQITTLVMGLSGIDWPGDDLLMEQRLRERLPIQDIKAVNDCIIALRAGTSSEYAAVLCVGSGTNCAVRNGNEEFVYGYYIPDEHQGGMAIGRWAVQAVFDAEMGLLPATCMRQLLLEFFGEPDVEHLLRRRAEGRITLQEYLALPPLVEEAALKGDIPAREVWRSYGHILGNYVVARMKKMGMTDDSIQVVLSGSIFKCRVSEFAQEVSHVILEYDQNAKIIHSTYEPIVGAVLMGLERIHNGRLPATVDQNLRGSALRYSICRF